MNKKNVTFFCQNVTCATKNVTRFFKINVNDKNTLNR